jgi:hypothetical protein
VLVTGRVAGHHAMPARGRVPHDVSKQLCHERTHCLAPTWGHFLDVAGAYPSAYLVSIERFVVNME